jgi:hypothetical protein
MRSNRPRAASDYIRQSRPDHDCIQIAGVVREIDPLLQFRLGADPARTNASE